MTRLREHGKPILGALALLGLLALLWWGLTPPVAAGPALQADGRLLLKHGELTVMVVETETAVDRALEHVAGYGGYVLSQRVWLDEAGYRYAAVTVGVPAASFEALLAAYKALGTLQSETLSGQDVTDQAVDLGSRIDNLDANQARTRGFLDQTTTLTETLHVFQSLRQLESQLGDLQGQRNFLEDRSAVATITLQLVPFIPTPTPTPTATPTPLPTPQSWRPGDTAQTAATTLQNNAQDAADFAIYRGIVCGPWLLGLALLAFLAWRGLRPRLLRPRLRRRAGSS